MEPPPPPPQKKQGLFSSRQGNRKKKKTRIGFPCFLLFSDSPCFFVCFPSFSKDFRGSAKRKTLDFFGVSLAFFQKRQGLQGQGEPFFQEPKAELEPSEPLSATGTGTVPAVKVLLTCTLTLSSESDVARGLRQERPQ